MADRAQVTSVEAVEVFRANLILFLSKARPALEEVSSDVQRTQSWLQDEQRKVWEADLRKRRRKLEQAQAELFSARLSTLQEVTTVQQMNLRRAQQAVRDAEDKLSLLKKWDRELENRAAPLLKQLEQMHSFLNTDMAKAVAYLAQVVKALEAYAGVLPGSSGASTPALQPGEPDANPGAPS